MIHFCCRRTKWSASSLMPPKTQPRGRMRFSHLDMRNKSKVLRLVLNMLSQSHPELGWHP